MALKRKILERDVELRLNKKAAQAGWESYKFTAINRRSVPDRLLLGDLTKVKDVIHKLLGLGRTAPPFVIEELAIEAMAASVTFVECKRPGEIPTPAQEREHAKLRERGFTVLVVDNFEQIDEIYGGGK